MNDKFVLVFRLGAVLSCSLAIASCARMGTQASPAPSGWAPVAAPAELDTRGAQWIKVDAPAGHKLLAAVFRPQGAGPFPVVVVLHGASGLQRDHLALRDNLSRAER
jgi:hypothetical protein